MCRNGKAAKKAGESEDLPEKNSHRDVCGFTKVSGYDDKKRVK